MARVGWSAGGATPRPFICGYCGKYVSSEKGFGSSVSGFIIYICPNCTNPTYFTADNRQIPGVAPGNEVEHLSPDIAALYRESRDCVAANCYTASVLICRKLLMNIGVSLGAQSGGTFISYVEYLADKGYVPPNGRGWVDHIRTKGNEATHEIVLMTKVDAEELIAFLEMLLKFIYEFPSKVPKA
jgi:Domain of unknown function (DUF4145)